MSNKPVLLTSMQASVAHDMLKGPACPEGITDALRAIASGEVVCTTQAAPDAPAGGVGEVEEALDYAERSHSGLQHEAMGHAAILAAEVRRLRQQEQNAKRYEFLRDQHDGGRDIYVEDIRHGHNTRLLKLDSICDKAMKESGCG